VLQDSDIELMLRVRADEPSAFEELVDRFRNRLVGLLLQLIGNAADAEDLAQEVFLRVYRVRQRYRAEARLSTWLYAIALNLARNARRAQRRRREFAHSIRHCGHVGPRPGGRVLYDSVDQPARKIEREELAAVVRRAVGGLKGRQRLAVWLNKFEGMSYADIARVMDVTPPVVKSLLCRARMRLRKALHEYVHLDGEPVRSNGDSATGP
jgi:RNA polymerase sigma-70 factor (ECF subfamily)